jgi:hypothetical protein
MAATLMKSTKLLTGIQTGYNQMSSAYPFLNIPWRLDVKATPIES